MKNIAIFIANGFEDAEAIVTFDVLKRANLNVELVSITDEYFVDSQAKITVKAHKLINDIDEDSYDCFVLPGGKLGYENLSKSAKLKSIIVNANKNHKIIAAICAAPQLLGKWNLVNKVDVTSYPGSKDHLNKAIYHTDVAAITSDNIITGASAGTVFQFSRAILDVLVEPEVHNEVFSKLVMMD
ncbi:DJ-1/PfpI family protein [Spiroplasma endosymbiont of Anurida maritima]|uniref:DJ-1 family glyoxalase III n=1 Tax=Spiroplasma endosymbiont of Anurida maritima TaxID=2967972 RepID=UPI0036D38F30